MVEALAPHSNCDLQDADGMTALMLAAKGGHLKCVRALHGRTNRLLRNKDGLAAVAIAASKLSDDTNGLKASDLLLFIRLFEPATAWDMGILPHLVGIDELFESAFPYCDPNGRDASGQSALELAIYLDNQAAFDLLLPVADLSLAGGDGQSPARILQIYERPKMEAAFQERMRSNIASSTRMPTKPGKTALEKSL
jgi:ankyrin repeat protein